MKSALRVNGASTLSAVHLRGRTIHRAAPLLDLSPCAAPAAAGSARSGSSFT